MASDPEGLLALRRHPGRPTRSEQVCQTLPLVLEAARASSARLAMRCCSPFLWQQRVRPLLDRRKRSDS